MREAVDILYDGRTEWLLAAPRIQGVSTHGTGCTYSAAITSYVARGATMVDAVRQAKEFITAAIAASRKVAGYPILNWAAGAKG
mgnify:CR=1 FL=1